MIKYDYILNSFRQRIAVSGGGGVQPYPAPTQFTLTTNQQIVEHGFVPVDGTSTLLEFGPKISGTWSARKSISATESMVEALWTTYSAGGNVLYLGFGNVDDFSVFRGFYVVGDGIPWPGEVYMITESGWIKVGNLPPSPMRFKVHFVNGLFRYYMDNVLVREENANRPNVYSIEIKEQNGGSYSSYVAMHELTYSA